MNIKKYISRLSSNKFVIFLFHGVIKQEVSNIRNYNKKHILESDFYSLLKELKSNGNPVSMDHIVNGHKLPENAYAITFDDGFENNFSVAAPILKKFKTPAIFYITSSFVNDNKMSWIDKIDYAIEHTKREKIIFMGKEFDLTSDNHKINFLKFVRKTSKENRAFFLAKDKYIRDIFAQSKISFCDSLNTAIDLKMSWNQVSKISQDELFTIGAHTHTHPIMSYLEEDDLNKEIEISINYLNKKCLLDVEHFSYPEGLDFCFNDNIVNKLKDAGIKCCPTAMDGVNNIHDDLFYLKRVTVI